MYRPFVAAHLTGAAPPAPGRFWVRRFARIYPAYWVALTVIVALFAARTMPTLRAAVAHYTLTYSYVHGTVASDIGLRQSWTLVMEVSFYALVPLWAWAVRAAGRAVGSRASEYAAAALLIVAGPIMMVVIHHERWAYTGIAPFLGLFGAGMLLAVAASDAAVATAAARVTSRVAPWWLAAAVVYVVFVVVVHIPPGGAGITYHQQIVERIVNAIVGFLLVAPLALGGRQPRRGESAWRPLAFVGLVSYGFYLWHYAVLDALHDHVLTGAGWRTFATLFVACSIGAGALGVASWLLIERPALRATDRLVDARRREAVA